MSLLDLVREPEVRARFDAILPPYARRLGGPLLAAPRCKDAQLVGNALDYALRFELHRRYPHAATRPWVAEHGARRVGPARAILAEAKAFVAEYLRSPGPTDDDRRALSGHAVRLAKLDAIHRRGAIDEHLDQADAEDVEDVLAMLVLVPFDRLSDPRTLILNPTFGEWSGRVVHADGDLIAGNRLIDFKSDRDAKVKREGVRQLLGYYLLTRRARAEGLGLPDIASLEIYFARYAEIWSMPVAPITANPALAATEAWFVEFAAAVRSDRQLR